VKELPEIAPEIRGLLEEIVADPRSAIRFAPRRALRSWFESDEILGARDVSRTRAEKHLIEAHREALAQLLYDAAKIAYWKAPELSLRPLGSDGRPYSPHEEEPLWRLRAEKRLGCTRMVSDGAELLRKCLTDVSPEDGHALALASLGLVRRDETRVCLACHLMKNQPRAALVVFERTASRTTSARIRGLAWGEVGARLVSLGRLEEAKEAYWRSKGDWPYAWFSLFNLACFTGKSGEATNCSKELGLLFSPDSSTVSEMSSLLTRWARERTEKEIRCARETVARIADGLSAPAREVSLAYA
jgi:hypothetical protein